MSKRDQLSKKRILLIASNPVGSSKLQLPKEFRDIEEALDIAQQGGHYEIKSIGATRYKDLRRQLLKNKPHIVHFSGHGVENAILLEDENEQQQKVNSQRLVELIEETNENIECVILNACDSEAMAETISQSIDYAVGMNAPVGDKTAIEFAVGFYDGIGNKHSYESAFNLGKNAFLQNIDDTQKQRSLKTPKESVLVTPILCKKPRKKLCKKPQENKHHPTQTNTHPWFHHTIDHQQLPSIDLFGKQENLIFGLFIAKGSHAPHSFAIHCYIEMLGGRCALDNDVEENIHYIKLNGIDNNSFENSVLKHSKINFLPQAQSEERHTIQNWLTGQGSVVVLHIHISSEDQQKQLNTIVQGAKDFLASLSLGNMKVLTLFRCNNSLPKKKWLFFNYKPPNCLFMGELRQLDKDDIYDWLDTLKQATQQKNHPEEELVHKVTEENFDYRTVLSHLQDIQYQYAR